MNLDDGDRIAVNSPGRYDWFGRDGESALKSSRPRLSSPLPCSVAPPGRSCKGKDEERAAGRLPPPDAVQRVPACNRECVAGLGVLMRCQSSKVGSGDVARLPMPGSRAGLPEASTTPRLGACSSLKGMGERRWLLGGFPSRRKYMETLRCEGSGPTRRKNNLLLFFVCAGAMNAPKIEERVFLLADEDK